MLNGARNNAVSMNLLLGVTGSVATIKLAEIKKELVAAASAREIVLSIRIISTKHALPFIPLDAGIEPSDIFTDDQEWREWKCLGDPVLHIELRKWADVFAICPLDANTLAKISNGFCDNLLVFPAMNVLMWQHRLTSQQLTLLNSWGVQTVDPIEKRLACGDFGIGGLPFPDVVAKIILDAWLLNRSLRHS